MKTTLEIKQMIADLYSHDGTIEQVTNLYYNNIQVKEAVDLMLIDINKKRLSKGLDIVTI